MLVDNRFQLTDPRELRGVTFLQNGQQFTGWVPVGIWEVIGESDVVTDRGKGIRTPTVMIVACGAGSWGTWYIGIEPARKLGWMA